MEKAKKGGLDNVKSIKREFGKSVSTDKPKKAKGYSEKEMVAKMDRYAKFAKTKAQKKAMEDLKQKHYTDKQRRHEKNGAKIKATEEGVKIGIHDRFAPDKERVRIAKEDRAHRGKTVQEAKAEYHQNYSLSKAYKETLERRIQKDKNKGLAKSK